MQLSGHKPEQGDRCDEHRNGSHSIELFASQSRDFRVAVSEENNGMGQRGGGFCSAKQFRSRSNSGSCRRRTRVMVHRYVKAASWPACFGHSDSERPPLPCPARKRSVPIGNFTEETSVASAEIDAHRLEWA
jgi:hypothetical protein